MLSHIKISHMTAFAVVFVAITAFTLFGFDNTSQAEGEKGTKDGISPAIGKYLERAEIEKIIEEYLRDNPQVIANALESMARKQQEEQENAAKQAITNNIDFLHNNPMAGTIGNPDGDVVLVEFFDYNCGFCKRALNDVLKLEEEDKNLKVVFIELPILGESSRTAAKFALAARNQNKYFEFHRAMMSHNGRLSDATIIDIATKMGLDINRLIKDSADPKIDAALRTNIEKASAMGIRGTPAFVVDDVLVRGAVGHDAIKETIADIRKNKSN